jgi:subtilisin family serine protease
MQLELGQQELVIVVAVVAVVADFFLIPTPFFLFLFRVSSNVCHGNKGDDRRLFWRLGDFFIRRQSVFLHDQQRKILFSKLRKQDKPRGESSGHGTGDNEQQYANRVERNESANCAKCLDGTLSAAAFFPIFTRVLFGDHLYGTNHAHHHHDTNCNRCGTQSNKCASNQDLLFGVRQIRGKYQAIQHYRHATKGNGDHLSFTFSAAANMLLVLVLFWCWASVVGGQQQQWVVELAPGTDVEAFARANGLTFQRRLEFLDSNLVAFESAVARRALPRATRSEGALWAEAQERRRQFPRVADPLYEQQWHLHSNAHAVDVDLQLVRDANVTGRGVTIAIVDDGLQHTHPELRANYDAVHSWDYNDNDADPAPGGSDDRHGTAVAGVAAAAKENGHCGRGVAPNARLVGVRAIADALSDLTESEALSHEGIATVDISSNSWGPSDDGRSMGYPGTLTHRAMALYAGQLRGRLGKGTVYVWAAGNGRQYNDSCAFDGYASSPYVIAIGALDHTGAQAAYSESCAALFAVAPSSGAQRGITTADLLGSPGYSLGECTDTFGGTSSAAPLASGIVALLLEKRPELTWRDVKHVIARGAVPINTRDGDWNINAAGFRHSPHYGFGLLKIPSLLVALDRHKLVPAHYSFFQSPLEIPTVGAVPWTWSCNVSGSGLSFVETVLVFVAIRHPRRGSLTVALRSPEGTTSLLAPPRPQDHHADYPAGGWTFGSVRHWGETTVDGVWNVTFADIRARSGYSGDQGRVNAIQLTIIGF